MEFYYSEVDLRGIDRTKLHSQDFSFHVMQDNPDETHKGGNHHRKNHFNL